MSETDASAPATNATVTDGGGRRTVAAVALVSFASLLLELGLTRIYSVVLFYHFAFLAISLALLGLGAGGVFAYLRREWLRRWSVGRLGWALCLLNAVLIFVAVEVTLLTPVTLELAGANLLRLSVIYVVCALPFFVTGLIFSVLFARQSARVAQLYAFDLGGGALACLAIVPLLNFVGGPNAVLCAALAMAVAALLWAETSVHRGVASAAMVACCALIALNQAHGWIDVVYAKGTRRDGPRVEFARWNAISRVQVEARGPGYREITIDADAATDIANAGPERCADPAWKRALMSPSQAMVNTLRPRGEYAIIGPGGGIDILRALCAGSPSVTGIEINSTIVNDVMRQRYASFSSGLYLRPDVHIHLSDGRSWIRGTRQSFDVIQMTLVDTWASTSAGAFALSENGLYTVEAFREYFDHLRPDGIIAITRWEFTEPREALRVVSLELAALRQLGITRPAPHFAVFADWVLRDAGRAVTVLAKRSPFTADEVALMRAHLAVHGKLQPLYMPSDAPLAPVQYEATGERPDWRAFNQLISLGSPEDFARQYPYDVRPVDDDAPFFFFTIKTKDIVDGVLHPRGRSMDWKVNLGLVVLLIVCGLSVAAVALFLIGPLALSRTARTQPGATLLYFVAIGLGFIMAEIAFIQRFVLFLGHPTYAVTVVIFLMLLASGVGSALSRRLLADPIRVRLALALIALGLLVCVAVLPGLLRGLVGLPFAAKLLISGAVLLPLGFVMGMPFPTGLRALAAARQSAGDAAVEWAWALNAGASVLGSVLAMVAAINFGLSFTLACGAGAYVVALLLTVGFRHSAR